jgi:sugar transferase (PEP-CTERM system associated)
MNVAAARPSAPRVKAVQLVAETFWVVVAVLLAMRLNDIPIFPLGDVLVPAGVFAALMVFLQLALGVYRRDADLEFGAYFGRVVLALLIAAPVAYFVADVLLRAGDGFRASVRDSVLLALAGLVLARRLLITPALRLLQPRRVLVLGTGAEARMVESSLALANARRVQLVGFYPLDKVQDSAVSPKQVITRTGTLEEVVQALDVDEVIVAVRQQRGGVLPLRSLLECRLHGVRITDLPGFFERVHCQIPIDSLKASWLIYGHGFRQGRLRTFVKRVFDLAAASALLILTLPVMALTAIAIVIESGFPIIYRQERVGVRGDPFNVLKFRSMRQDAEKDGKAKWATQNDPRVTSFGRFLRRTRIDELPQLINVFRGEMSFVGPRPERAVFVEMLTDQIPFYAVRHSVKPGITGWAQVRYSYGANVEESLKKLEYDLYYVKNHTLMLDLRILFETVRVVLSGSGAR